MIVQTFLTGFKNNTMIGIIGFLSIGNPYYWYGLFVIIYTLLYILSLARFFPACLCLFNMLINRTLLYLHLLGRLNIILLTCVSQGPSGTQMVSSNWVVWTESNRETIYKGIDKEQEKPRKNSTRF